MAGSNQDFKRGKEGREEGQWDGGRGSGITKQDSKYV